MTSLYRIAVASDAHDLCSYVSICLLNMHFVDSSNQWPRGSYIGRQVANGWDLVFRRACGGKTGQRYQCGVSRYQNVKQQLLSKVAGTVLNAVF